MCIRDRGCCRRWRHWSSRQRGAIRKAPFAGLAAAPGSWRTRWRPRATGLATRRSRLCWAAWGTASKATKRPRKAPVSYTHLDVYKRQLQQQPSAHLTAEAIFQALGGSGEEIGLATVYRVLTQFEASGLVKRYHFESGQSVFEINQGGHHDHMLCLDCLLYTSRCV